VAAPAIAAPVVAGWIVLQLRMAGRREERAAAHGRAVPERPLRRAGDTAAADRKRFGPIAAAVVVGVVVFVAAMGLIAGYL
jgi:hypothetical protein